MTESNIPREDFSFPERSKLIQGLLKVKSLEESPRERRNPPNEIILLGGGGLTGKQFGNFFAEAGMPVCEVIDILPKDKAVSLEALPNAAYVQLPSPFDEQTIEDAIKEHPNAAVHIMTPQGTHLEWLQSLAPIITKYKTPLSIEKPIAMNAQEAQKIIEIIDRYPKLAHQITAGSYTTFKAAALLGMFGAIDRKSPVLSHIKPLDDKTPDFQDAYMGKSQNLGKLVNGSCIFIEGRKNIREVIGKYNRKHLALYPKGGMTADLLGHPLDPLVSLGMINPNVKFSKVYLGYLPIDAGTSFPWQVPTGKGLAEIEGEVTLLAKENAPIFVTYGKRGPESLGDIRRSMLKFENGTVIEIQYLTSPEGKSNIVIVRRPEGPTHSYYLDQNPYLSMLEQDKGLWSGTLQGEGGIYGQLFNGFMIEDIHRIWRGEDPIIFTKAKNFREQRDKVSPGYQERQDRDFRTITKDE